MEKNFEKIRVRVAGVSDSLLLFFHLPPVLINWTPQTQMLSPPSFSPEIRFRISEEEKNLLKGA